MRILSVTNRVRGQDFYEWACRNPQILGQNKPYHVYLKQFNGPAAPIAAGLNQAFKPNQSSVDPLGDEKACIL